MPSLGKLENQSMRNSILLSNFSHNFIQTEFWSILLYKYIYLSLDLSFIVILKER